MKHISILRDFIRNAVFYSLLASENSSLARDGKIHIFCLVNGGDFVVLAFALVFSFLSVCVSLGAPRVPYM